MQAAITASTRRGVPPYPSGVKSALALLCTLLLGVGSAFAGDPPPPPLPIHKAIELAQQVLDSAGVSDHVYIAQVAFRRDAIFIPKSVWEVIWSRPIDGSKKGKFEMGVEVSMSGEVTHLVKSRINVQPVNAH